MTLAASAPSWLAALFFLLLLLAAAEDAWRMEIADWTSGGVAAGALVAALLAGVNADLWQNLALSGAALGLGWLLFRLGGWGGGDVKLLVAAALWFDLSTGWRMLVMISLVGGTETIILLILRNLPWPETLRHRVLPLHHDEGIPYGIAIALGVASMVWWLRR